MGTRADFYMEQDEKLEWVGSLYKDGHPWHIPTDILIQVNPVMFEELVTEFLETKDSAIKKNGDGWPWPWADSRMSDYSYILIEGKVFAYSPQAKHLFDPIKVVQGEDLINAQAPFYTPFPIMRKETIISTEELLDQYGLQPTKTL